MNGKRLTCTSWMVDCMEVAHLPGDDPFHTPDSSEHFWLYHTVIIDGYYWSITDFAENGLAERSHSRLAPNERLTRAGCLAGKWLCYKLSSTELDRTICRNNRVSHNLTNAVQGCSPRRTMSHIEIGCILTKLARIHGKNGTLLLRDCDHSRICVAASQSAMSGLI